MTSPSVALPRATLSAASRKRRHYLIAFIFVAPALLNFVVFRYFPIVSAVWVSLWDYSLLGGFGDFRGFDNYLQAFGDDVFLNSMLVTGIYAVVKVPLQILFALALALLVQRESRLMGVVRSAIFTPVVTSMMVVAIVWAMMLHSQTGLVNGMFSTFGLPRLGFLSDPNLALGTVIFVTIWKDVGFSMIILLAGMKGIPDMYYEAAVIDGANRWQMFWQITIPLLMRVMLFVVVTQTVNAFQVFIPVYAMTRGGPQDATKVVNYLIYQQAFTYQNMGYASTMSVIVLAVILVVSLVLMRVLRSDVEY
jgi:ABC-type sugar transport system permease subunit